MCRVHQRRYERCARSSRCRRRRWRVGPPTSSASGCATASRSEERSLALSGGRTPARMLELFGEEAHVPWEAVDVYQADERIAPRRSGAQPSTARERPFRWRVSTRCRWRKAIPPPPWRATKPPCPSVSTSCISARPRRPHGLARPGLRRTQGSGTATSPSPASTRPASHDAHVPRPRSSSGGAVVVTGADKREALGIALRDESIPAARVRTLVQTVITDIPVTYP